MIPECYSAAQAKLPEGGGGTMGSCRPGAPNHERKQIDTSINNTSLEK